MAPHCGLRRFEPLTEYFEPKLELFYIYILFTHTFSYIIIILRILVLFGVSVHDTVFYVAMSYTFYNRLL